MDLHLKGKVALVTGGARGLGKAICTDLAAEGCNVAVNCRPPGDRDHPIDEAQNFVQQLTDDYGVNAMLATADVSQSGDVFDMFDSVESQLGKIDVLINNAAIWPTALIKDVDQEDWDRTVAINLTGAFLTCRQAVRRWLDTETKGRIVNVVSQAAFLGSTTGHAHYAASKAGLVNFTISLAREVASKGINVNALAPGMMTTDMTEEVFKTGIQQYLDRIPAGRIADPAEVAHVATFLASDRASYITGATLNATGGMLMR